jgi:diguanylate cyclase (GGDEF)-like protein
LTATPQFRVQREGRRARLCWVAMLSAALFLALPISGQADPPAPDSRWSGLAETIFQNYGRQEGLPHPVPTALAQDADGFLWVGTQGGLARWDGYRFEAYKPDPRKPGALPDGWIHALHTDPRGRLWIGTSASGLVLYDRMQDRFTPIPVDAEIDGRTHIEVIADDGTGGLWLATEDGLRHLDPQSGALRALRHDAQDPASLPDNKIGAVLCDRAGRLWVGTGRGLVRQDTEASPFRPVPLADFAEGTPQITALHEAADGRIWIGTVRHGVYVADAGGDTARPAITLAGADTALQTDTVSAISAAGPQEIWAATRGGGLVVIELATGRMRRIRHDRTLPNSLAHDDLWTLLQDDAGSIWVGGTGGLSYHPPSLVAVSTLFGASDRPNGLSGADPYSILPTTDGRVWFGYLNGGVDIVDPHAGLVAALRPDSNRPETALPQDIVTGMAEIPGGPVFIGTRRGVYRVTGAGHDVAAWPMAQHDPHAPVETLLFDRGVLWLGGLEDGLWGVRPEDGAVISHVLADQSVNCLLSGTGQDLWIGMLSGLARLDRATGEIEQIRPDPADEAALPARFVSSLLFDKDGRLWVATFGGGVAVMTGRDAGGRPRFHRLGVADGLPHANADTLEPGPDGTIWVGTDDGLAVIDTATLSVRPLRRADGAVLADYFTSSGAVDRAGEALFGSIGGVAILRPERPGNWELRAPIVVSDIRVGGKALPIGPFNGAGTPPPLEVTPEADSLAVEFAALDFTAPSRNRYAYRLEGFDRDWVETDATRRLAVYTNLPPGRYTLRLRGSNRDGIWTERALSIPIRVLPAWYQTLWFELLAGFAALAAVAALVRSRTGLLRRRQAELERQVAERTADLSAANDQLVEMATTDPLTGCANRRHFVERAGALIALGQRQGTPLTLVLLDLDHFKTINDTHGHPAGDAMLSMIGTLTRDLIRSTDLLGRLGGEEFALLMPNTTALGAAQLADRLRRAIEQAELPVGGARLRITASLGMAVRHPGEGFDALYARADAALYAAKTAGRNRLSVAAAS